MSNFKVIVAGGREFTDYARLSSYLDLLLQMKIDEGITISIISGTARGADQLGERYALERNIDLLRMPAQWNTHGKSAGYKRNAAMAEEGDALVACWDGESRGTLHMINIAKKAGLPTRVLEYGSE